MRQIYIEISEKKGKKLKKMVLSLIVTWVSWFGLINQASTFTLISTKSAFISSRDRNRSQFSIFSQIQPNLETSPRRTVELADHGEEYQGFVRAPIKFIGPYPCLALQFPMLATEKQKKEGKSGIALDFVLDTAANTNTISPLVARELKLQEIGKAPGGVGAGGVISSGLIYNLGDCQIDIPKQFPLEVRNYYRPQIVMKQPNGDYADANIMSLNTIETVHGNDIVNQIAPNVAENVNGLGNDELIEDPPFIFMTNLSASSLPLAAPGAAGLLSNTFLNVFEGGVEFEWKPKQLQLDPVEDDESMALRVPATVTFHSTKDTIQDLGKLTPVPIKILTKTNLPCIKIKLNGSKPISALLDTGSPITVLNAAAARIANIETMTIEDDASKDKNSLGWNLLEKLFKGAKESTAKTKAASRGDLLRVGGQGRPTELLRYKSPITISVNENDDLMDNVSIFVGDLPGLDVLGNLGEDDAPNAILGMDVLRQLDRMVYTPQTVYFDLR